MEMIMAFVAFHETRVIFLTSVLEKEWKIKTSP